MKQLLRFGGLVVVIGAALMVSRAQAQETLTLSGGTEDPTLSALPWLLWWQWCSFSLRGDLLRNTPSHNRFHRI